MKWKSGYWKYVKRIAGMIGGVLLFISICHMLNDIYVYEEDWCRVLWHNFYEDDGSIDYLYLGSSHVYSDINPMQLDAVNGKSNFNLASPSQFLNGSYYLLREADKNNSLSHIYLELYYLINTNETFLGNREPMDAYPQNNWNNSDQMKNSLLKWEYMLSIADIEEYPAVFLPFSRYHAYLNDWDYIKERFDTKNTQEYLNYKYFEGTPDGNNYIEYKEQGYFYSTGTFSDEERICEQKRILEENPMGEMSEVYLRKIISYCQKEDIPLTLFIAPVNELQLISAYNYDNYSNQVREIAKEYGVEFYDFNLAKEEYLPIQNGKYFRDIEHLNVEGAKLFTAFFDEVVSGNAVENEKYFYSSYAEKLQQQPPTVYGLYFEKAKVIEDSILSRRYWIASNKKEMEYRIIITPDEKDQYMVQDFAENSVFTIPAEESGICTIVIRMKDAPDDVWTEEVRYLNID